MSRRLIILAAACAAIVSASAYAAHRDIDLKDYDDDLMRDLDKTIKYFEPDITAGNAEGALEDAGILQDGFKYTEKYFSKKADADDAVKISRDGLAYIEAAVKALQANDFSAAAEAARGAAATCRACHEIYKPLKK